MAATKDAAIELEIRMAEAAELGDPALAYRLGLLEACRLISDVRGYYGSKIDGWEMGRVAWEAVFDAAKFLRDANHQELA